MLLNLSNFLPKINLRWVSYIGPKVLSGCACEKESSHVVILSCTNVKAEYFGYMFHLEINLGLNLCFKVIF